MGFYCHVSYTFFQGTFANPDLFSSFLDSDGNGSLFGTLSGNTREVIHKFTVDLPKKHGRGGQSALRFSRLREEARRNYVRKVAELAVQHFITADKVNVAGLVLAGSAELKTDLSGSDLFDPRLLAKVVKVVDVSYGGENGFNQAIELAADSLANVKFVQEKKLIQKYFDEIALDTGKYCFGISDTLKALEMGAVETLIVWENLEMTRNTLRNAADGKSSSFYISSHHLCVRTNFGIAVSQRKLSSSLPPPTRTERSLWTNPPVSRWNKPRNRNPCSNGLPKSTANLVPPSNSSPTSLRKARNL